MSNCLLNITSITKTLETADQAIYLIITPEVYYNVSIFVKFYDVDDKIIKDWFAYEQLSSTEQTLSIDRNYINPNNNNIQKIYRIDFKLAGNCVTDCDTDTAPPTKASAPTIAYAIPKNSGVSLGWLPPADSGNSIISKYVVESSINSGDNWSFVNNYITTSGDITNLTNGTEYIFRIAAVNTAGSGDYSIPSIPVIPDSAPGPVSDIQITYNYNNDDKTILVSWDPPVINTYTKNTVYTIQWKPQSGSTWTTILDNHPLTYRAITGFMAGISYQVRIAAKNNIGISSFVESNTITVVHKPGPPTNLQVTNNSGIITLGWSQPSYNGGAPIQSYSIEYSSNSGVSWSAPTNTSNTNIVFNNLNQGSSYLFRIRSYNGLYYSDFNTLSSSTIVATAPSAPIITNVIPRDSEIQVTWSEPSNGGQNIIDYIIQYSSNNGSSWQTVADGVSTNTEYVIKNLNNNTAYIIRVAAINSIGQGNFSSNSSSVTPIASPILAPSAPQSVSYVANDKSIDLSWSAPANNGGSGITGYIIQYSSNNGTTWTTRTVAFNITSYIIQSLTNGVQYSVRIAAKNNSKTGEYFTVPETIIPATIPSAPTSVLCKIIRSEDEQNEDGLPKLYIQINWSLNTNITYGSPITAHYVEYKRSDNNAWTRIDTPYSNTSALLDLELFDIGKSYNFRVQSENNKGLSLFKESLSLVIIDYPGAPTGVTAVLGSLASINKDIIVSWIEPSDKGGSSTNLSYIVEYFTSDNPNNWIKNTVNTGTSFKLTNLKTSGVSYSFRVAAFNGLNGPFSLQTSSVRIPSAPIAPLIREVDNVPTGVAISWSLDDIQSFSFPVTEVEIYYSTDNKRFISLTKITDPSIRSVIIPPNKFITNTAYYFRMTAKNSIGTSVLGEIFPSNTTAAFKLKTTPPAPIGLSATNPSTNTISLKWSMDSALDTTNVKYLIEYKKASDSEWIIFASSHPNNSIDISNLQTATQYEFKITAFNDIGISTKFSSIKATPYIIYTAPKNVSLFAFPMTSTYYSTINNNYPGLKVVFNLSIPDDGGQPVNPLTDIGFEYSSDGGRTFQSIGRHGSNKFSSAGPAWVSLPSNLFNNPDNGWPANTPKPPQQQFAFSLPQANLIFRAWVKNSIGKTYSNVTNSMMGAIPQVSSTFNFTNVSETIVGYTEFLNTVAQHPNINQYTRDGLLSIERSWKNTPIIKLQWNHIKYPADHPNNANKPVPWSYLWLELFYGTAVLSPNPIRGFGTSVKDYARGLYPFAKPILPAHGTASNMWAKTDDGSSYQSISQDFDGVLNPSGQRYNLIGQPFSYSTSYNSNELFVGNNIAFVCDNEKTQLFIGGLTPGQQFKFRLEYGNYLHKAVTLTDTVTAQFVPGDGLDLSPPASVIADVSNDGTNINIQFLKSLVRVYSSNIPTWDYRGYEEFQTFTLADKNQYLPSNVSSDGTQNSYGIFDMAGNNSELIYAPTLKTKTSWYGPQFNAGYIPVGGSYKKDLNAFAIDFNNLELSPAGFLTENNNSEKQRNLIGNTYTNETIGLRVGHTNISKPTMSGFVYIGDANNPGDPIITTQTTRSTGLTGTVPYEYWIKNNMVTVTEYVEFLNAVATINDLNSLYVADMTKYFGIVRTRPNINAPYTYSIQNITKNTPEGPVSASPANIPMGYMTVPRAKRYCNWLHNNKPTSGIQSIETTEAGSYSIGFNTERSTNATYIIPEINEWYKAAFFIDYQATDIYKTSGLNTNRLYANSADSSAFVPSTRVNVDLNYWKELLDNDIFSPNIIPGSNHRLVPEIDPDTYDSLPIGLNTNIFVDYQIDYEIQYITSDNYADIVSWSSAQAWKTLDSTNLIFSEIDQQTLQTNINMDIFENILDKTKWIKFRIIPFVNGKTIASPSRASNPILYIKNYPEIVDIDVSSISKGYAKLDLTYNNIDSVPIKQVKIEYSTDNGVTWQTVQDNVRSDYRKDAIPFIYKPRYINIT